MVPSKVLVADELSLGLAPVIVDTVYEGLREINRNGTALVVVEQQVNRVLDLANWAVVLNHGQRRLPGRPRGRQRRRGDPDGAPRGSGRVGRGRGRRPRTRPKYPLPRPTDLRRTEEATS